MTKKSELFSVLIRKANKIATNKSGNEEKLRTICKMLRDDVSYYNWVGFYIVDPKNKHELLLGPFEGEPTEHVRIPFGKGICGQAAELRRTFVVQDVSEENNYLSCSRNVRAEIVTPIFKDKEIIGEIDVDSHTRSPFTEEDKVFLSKISEIAAKLL